MQGIVPRLGLATCRRNVRATMNLLYAADAPITPLQGKTVAVLGFGNQGHAHALNLRDSGVHVIVANRPDSANARLAVERGFDPLPVAEAVEAAEVVLIALPDEAQPEVYEQHIAPHLTAGMCLGFVHGMNIHFRLITPPTHVDVVMVAPKGPGKMLRSFYEAGGGLPCLAAVAQNATGQARDIALAWANGIGGGRGGIFEATFKDECETDLFGEQAVLCGGLAALIKAGYETLVEAGYPPEMAYFECVHEVKLITDLIHQGGLTHMHARISNTAEYGGLTRGPRIIDDAAKQRMKEILTEIQSGQFAREWRAEHQGGMKEFKRLYEQDCDAGIEKVGKNVRGLMPWLSAKERPKD